MTLQPRDLSGRFGPVQRPAAAVALTPPGFEPFAGDIETLDGPPDEFACEPGGQSLIASEDGRRVGYLHFEEQTPGRVTIHHMFTEQAETGRGVASRLMDALVASRHPATTYSTTEFSAEGQVFADRYAARTGIRIVDDSADWSDDENDWSDDEF